MKKVRIIASIIELVIGFALVVCSGFNLVDEFWSGCGVALIVVGALFLFRSNKDYREEIDIKNSDERNRYLSMKAWSWAGYLFVLIASFGTIAFKLAGKEELMMLCSGAVCLVILLYWISYIIVRKKY